MYYRPRIIPCLSIIGEDLVKTTKFKNPRYLGDPVNAVKIFNDKGVDELCVLDIRASSEKQAPNMDFIRDIASEAFMPLSYGGGIKTLQQVEEIFHMGYEKVIINTAFYDNPNFIKEAARLAGSQSIVVSIDVRNEFLGKRVCYKEDGKVKTGKDPIEMAKYAESLGAGEILLNSITNDGMMQGYDLKMIKAVSDAVTIPVIACGGASGLEDIRKVLEDGHAHAAAAGSIFVFYGSEKAVLITMPEEEELKKAGIYKE